MSRSAVGDFPFASTFSSMTSSEENTACCKASVGSETAVLKKRGLFWQKNVATENCQWMDGLSTEPLLQSFSRTARNA
eukprot:m.125136 g.125136  ORF g.125136 m.125136 type:complete len:78 (-) comp17316_c0_seq2:159-392(-)